MNQGRLFVAGRVLHENLRMAGTSPQGQTIEMPSGATFISHQSNDKVAAEKIAAVLSGRGYPCYLDTLDPNVDGDSPDLERYLRWIIGLCNSLMAVVSFATKTSWWVPLEIGVAIEKQKHIATYLLGAEDLPSYLWQWPMLWNDQDAIAWAQDSQNQSSTVMNTNWRSRSRHEKLGYIRQ